MTASRCSRQETKVANFIATSTKCTPRYSLHLRVRKTTRFRTWMLWRYVKEEVELELDFIKSVYLENGYHLEVIKSSIRAVQLQEKKKSVFRPEKCPVYLKLPCIGMASKQFSTAVQNAVHNGYHNARAVVIFQAREMLPNSNKDVLPLLATSSVVYKFVCCCDNSYVWCTTQRLGSRIKQHVPKYAINLSDSRILAMQKQVIRCTRRKALVSASSAILKHLLKNDSCARWYTSVSFTVIGRAEKTSKLCVKEALLIYRHKPILNI